MKLLFRFRRVEWPRVVKAPVDPVVRAFVEKAKAHFRLCVECDDRRAVSEMLGFPDIALVGRRHVVKFIKENTTDAVWFKLRSESGLDKIGQ